MDDKEIEEFAKCEIGRRGDRALAYARGKRDNPMRGTDPVRERTFWGKVVAAIEAIEACEPSMAVLDCLLCGHVAEKTLVKLNGPVEQFCANCGLFQVSPALFAKWQADPKPKRWTLAIELYLQDCFERQTLPVFDDLTLARIERQYK